MTKKFKRIIAAVLTAVMVTTLMPALPAYADETYNEVYAYNLEEQKVKFLGDESIKGSRITFPLSGAQVNMGDELVYHLFRQGNTEKAHTVTLATMDLTAAYGDDYEIILDGEPVPGEAKVLMDGDSTTYNVYLGEDIMGEAKAKAAAESGNGRVQTTEEQLDQNSSSEFEITFETGEQVKEIRIRAEKPVKAVGNKEFQLSIKELGEGAEAGEFTNSAITLAETREVEESEVKIVPGSSEVVDGYVTAIVKRSGNTETYTSYNVSAEDGTAVNGEDYILKSTQLIFTPGVSKQRVHIPLAASDESKTKNFTLKAGESEEKITYETSKVGATVFKSQRDLLDIPMENFVLGNKTGGSVTFEEDGESYTFELQTGSGEGDNRGASIRTKDRYDFIGIKEIKLSASYRLKTIVGDHLDIYASNEDYYNNKSMLGALASNGYGKRLDTVSLTGQGIHTIPVNREGEYYIYMTIEQHGAMGTAGYNLYNQDFNGGDKGHVALVKEKYSLEIVGPDAVGTGGVPAGDIGLELTTDKSVNGQRIDVYRDESFNINYTLMNKETHFAGYEFLDESNHVYHTVKTTVPVFTLSPELLHAFSDRFSDHKIKIRPLFEYETTEVVVKEQDFAAMGVDSVLSAQINEATHTAAYYDNGIEIATIKWSDDYTMGRTLKFEVKENMNYGGDYHFSAFKVVTGTSSDTGLTNPIYYTDENWSTTLEKGYYEITPIITNKKAELLLNVSGATHGNFEGKPENLTEDTYVVREYEEKGNYDTSDIVTFTAEPDKGYRAKWTYRDIASGEKLAYYGNYFYYQVQAAVMQTDNTVELEFIETDSLEKYDITAQVFMQGGNVLHQPQENSAEYTPLTSGIVSLEGVSKETEEDGSAGVFSTEAKPGDKLTALVKANNRYYVQPVEIGSSGKSVNQQMKLSYYYEGPRVTSVQYYDYDGTLQSGDTIFLENETDGCVIGATIETAGKDVTDVVFKLKDSEGNVKGEFTAERNNAEYIWSASLGTFADEDDQIWIELKHKGRDSSGKEVYTSYGEVNTGYRINIADYSNVSYIPDTGLYKDLKNVPLFGTLYPMFGVKAIKPVITASNTGNMTNLSIGFSVNGGYNFTKKEGFFATWSQYWGLVEKTAEAMGELAENDNKIQAKQVLKRNSLALSLSVTAQLALYNRVDPETNQSRLLCVGVFMVFGFNANYLYNIPMIAKGIPFFVAFAISGKLSDSVQVYSRDPSGYTDLEAMHDPTKSQYTPETNMNFTASFTVTFGAGVNGLADVGGGGSGALALNWNDYTYGTGVLTGSIVFQLELAVFGGTVSLTEGSYKLFDTNPANTAALASETEENILEMPLTDFKMKPLEEYKQSAQANLSQTREISTGKVLTDAYNFSKPELIDMGNEKYMIVSTVDSRLVADLSENEDANAVLAYAVYNKNTGRFESTGEGTGKIFRSIEPENIVGDSINYHPYVIDLGDGKYHITWNSIIYPENKEDFNITNVRSVIKSAILDTQTGDITYKSLVQQDKTGKLMSSIVQGTVYDKNTDEVIMIYRVINNTGLDENSTLADYLDAGAVLMQTSINASEAVKDENVTYAKGTVIDSGGKSDGKHSVIKNVDVAMMQDGDKEIPVIAYNMTTGKQANVIATAEEDSVNELKLISLKYNGNKYEKDIQKDVPLQNNGDYIAQPELLSAEVEGKMQNILIWKNIRTEDGNTGRIAMAEPVELMKDKDEYEGGNIATIVNEAAGAMEDVQILSDQNGGVYAIWTEREENRTKVMMSAMETDGDYTAEDGKRTDAAGMRWGLGSAIFETTEDSIIKNFSASIEDDKVIVLYREASLDGEESNIRLCEADLGSKLTQISYAGLEDNEADEYKKSGIDNLEISLSDNNPHPGQSIKVRARVRNAGVQAVKGEEVQLCVNGEPVKGAVAIVQNLGAGEEQEVEFDYQVPENYGKARGNSEFEFSIIGAESTGKNSETITAASEVNISEIRMTPLNYPAEGEDSSYLVRVFVRNDGNIISDEASLMIDRLKFSNDENSEEGKSTLSGTNLMDEPARVPELDPGEEDVVRFKLTVPDSCFTDETGYLNNNELGLARVGFAIYDNYGEEDQQMIAALQDYIKKNQSEEATSITVDNLKVGKGQSCNLPVVVKPAAAQIHTDLSFESSDSKIAVVDENGIITGVSNGKCDITVTTANGIQKTVTVTVSDKPVDDKPVIDPDPGNNNDVDPEINPYPDDMSSKTGDDMNLLLWLLILITAVTAGIAVYRSRRVRQ